MFFVNNVNHYHGHLVERLDIVKPKLIHKAGQTLIDISNKMS